MLFFVFHEVKVYVPLVPVYEESSPLQVVLGPFGRQPLSFSVCDEVSVPVWFLGD